MKILHLMTGGTIAGKCPEYGPIEYLAEIFFDYVDIQKYIVYSMKANCEYDFIKICHKDSREIINLDRQRIVDEIEKGYKKGVKLFLITHGTYTMPETGKYVEQKLEKGILSDVSIVITGAMYPWNLVGSDAPMNVGASISSLLNTERPLGVKICMHGKNRDVDNIEEDTDKLIFHAKTE